MVGVIRRRYVVGDVIDYAYVQINQTQSNEQQMITVSATLGGTAQHLDTTTGKHENVALQRLRDSSHLYMGTFANNKMSLRQLKDDDGTKYLDGSIATMTGANGDHWLRINEPFYIKRVSGTDSGDVVTYAIAVGGQPDSDWKQIIGTDELLGVHEAIASNTGNNTSGVLYSKSGSASSGTISQFNFRQKARNKGTGFTLVTWEWHCVMQLLFYAWYERTNAQAQCGSGSNSYSRTLGGKNSFGMGDTTSTSGNTNCTKFWGIENWWGDKHELVDNVIINNHVWTITDVKTGNTRTAGTDCSASGYITKMLLSENLDFIPVETSNGSTTTYYCDNYYTGSTGYTIALRSFYIDNVSGGVSFIHTGRNSSYTAAALGTRLAYHGDIEIIS